MIITTYYVSYDDIYYTIHILIHIHSIHNSYHYHYHCYYRHYYYRHYYYRHYYYLHYYYYYLHYHYYHYFHINIVLGEIFKIFGKGPKIILSNYVQDYLKYETASRTFKILPTKNLSATVDAIAVDPAKLKKILNNLVT